MSYSPPPVYVEATSDAAQVVTGNVTDLQYEDEVQDTHNAWATSQFVAPYDDIYWFMASAGNDGVTSDFYARKNGTEFLRQGNNGTDFRTTVVGSIYLLRGDILTFRTAVSFTRSAVPSSNRLTICSLGRIR